MSCVAKARLAEERKAWRKDHPFGFVAKPAQLPPGETNLLLWNCMIPGKNGTDWEGGLYPVQLKFTNDYPSVAPVAHFDANFFHPNVYPSGKVCLSILTTGWRPSITVKQVLIGIQDLLDNPNVADSAQEAAYRKYTKSLTEYKILVRKQAQKYRSE
mmetsp:Transcript_11450/g.32502  ORF Transcript_11450/g.32502 Transcript_11450/m.32502 type:complete len:157 (+) Transcript_11450:138-608(+)